MGKVILRPWERGDAAALLVLRNSTPDLDKQFAADIDTVDDAASYISEYLPFNERTKNWAIVVDGVPVGNVGLSDITKRNESAWAFYWLADKARGHGYASNALATVANWAFQNQIFRIELGHRTNNPPSCAVATNAGFLVEGLERQKLKYGDSRFDVELHSRLATDPMPTKATIYPLTHSTESPLKWKVIKGEPMPDDVARLLETVPDWFGQSESNAEYINDARSMETWAVLGDGGAVIGLVLLAQHFPHALEIHLMVVDSAYHGQGIGTALIKAIEADAKRKGVRLLEVKTLAATHPDVHYARTRHFYAKMGFIPLEITDLWGEDTPCLIMVKPLV
jgi:RimJ/RimL family protein N-acetyltransferase